MGRMGWDGRIIPLREGIPEKKLSFKQITRQPPALYMQIGKKCQRAR